MPGRREVGGWACLLAAALALVNGGCLALVAGAAAGGAAAAGYAYYNGRLYRDFPAGMADAAAAVRTSLAELQLPVVSETMANGSVVVISRAGDGAKVDVQLDLVPSRIPAEGALTRVSVRVGAFGDEEVSGHILDRVSMHLAPASAAVQPTPAAPPAETAPPPLAAPEPPKRN